jgi:hypothetical protein
MPLNQCKRFSDWKGVTWVTSMPVLCSRKSKARCEELVVLIGRTLSEPRDSHGGLRRLWLPLPSQPSPPRRSAQAVQGHAGASSIMASLMNDITLRNAIPSSSPRS